MANYKIRQEIKEKGLCQWEIAMEIGISEGTFCKWLRCELSEDKRQQVISAIERLSRREVE